MSRDRLADAEEWNCVSCGNVEYGEGFEVLDVAVDTKRGREPSHGKVRL